MVLETDFAGIILGLSAKDKIHNILVEKRFGIFNLFLTFLDSIKELTNIVLNTTKFKRHSRDYIIKLLLSLHPCASNKFLSLPTIK